MGLQPVLEPHAKVLLFKQVSIYPVYISVLGREGGPAPVVKALNKASGHVRTEVSRRMHIRKAPRFVFVADEGAAYAAHINKLLDELAVAEGGGAE